MTLTIPTVLWVALAAAVLLLAGYRKFLARNEDDLVHIAEGEASMISEQTVLAHKLEVIDRWGKILTVAALVYGLILAAIFLYRVWLEQATIPQ